MPIDPSIALQVQAPQNPLAQFAQVAQIQGLQNQNRLADLKFTQAERENAQRNKLAELYGMGGTEDEVAGRLLKSGFQKEALDLRKAQTDRAKANADLGKSQIEAVVKVNGLFGSTAKALLDNPATTYADVVAEAERLRTMVPKEFHSALDVSKLPQDPQALRAALTKLYTGSIETEKLLADATSRRNNDQNTQTQIQTTRMSNEQSDKNNQRTVGASYANAAATREVARATRDAASIAAESKRVQETEMKLADDYRAESKGFAETSTAMKKVMAAIETADKNPGSALAAGTGFMKILDPNSVVRETELGMALNASGWFDRATNIANTLQNGRVMTAEQKVNLKKAAKDLFEEAKAAQREIDAAYTKRASDYKLDPKRVITDRGQNSRPPVDLNSLPGGGAPKTIDFGSLK